MFSFRPRYSTWCFTLRTEDTQSTSVLRFNFFFFLKTFMSLKKEKRVESQRLQISLCRMPALNWEKQMFIRGPTRPNVGLHWLKCVCVMVNQLVWTQWFDWTRGLQGFTALGRLPSVLWTRTVSQVLSYRISACYDTDHPTSEISLLVKEKTSMGKSQHVLWGNLSVLRIKLHPVPLLWCLTPTRFLTSHLVPAGHPREAAAPLVEGITASYCAQISSILPTFSP